MAASPFVIIVGPCASGKTTLMQGLTALGHNARSIAQEHSYVPYFWSLKRPDLLVMLDAEIETVRRRRAVSYGQERIDAQRRQLAHARQHCNLYLPTDDLTIDQVRERVIELIERWKEAHHAAS